MGSWGPYAGGDSWRSSWQDEWGQGRSWKGNGKGYGKSSGKGGAPKGFGKGFKGADISLSSALERVRAAVAEQEAIHRLAPLLQAHEQAPPPVPPGMWWPDDAGAVPPGGSRAPTLMQMAGAALASAGVGVGTIVVQAVTKGVKSFFEGGVGASTCAAAPSLPAQIATALGGQTAAAAHEEPPDAMVQKLAAENAKLRADLKRLRGAAEPPAAGSRMRAPPPADPHLAALDKLTEAVRASLVGAAGAGAGMAEAPAGADPEPATADVGLPAFVTPTAHKAFFEWLGSSSTLKGGMGAESWVKQASKRWAAAEWQRRGKAAKVTGLPESREAMVLRLLEVFAERHPEFVAGGEA